jgi:DNA-binding MarR family transcriptional regulator
LKEGATVLPTVGQAHDFGGLRREIGFALRLAHVAVHNDLVASFRPFDPRPAEYAALRIVRANPGVRQGVIGAAVRLKAPNLVAMIARMEARGLIAKTKDADDRRANGLTITALGKTTLRRADAAQARHHARLAATISDAERPLLIDMLYRLGALDPAPEDDLPEE